MKCMSRPSRIAWGGLKAASTRLTRRMCTGAPTVIVFFAQCLEELPAALKKLHGGSPGIGAGRGAEGQSCGVGEFGAGSAGVSGEAGQTVAAHRHLHEACGAVPEKRLAEVCEVEQDIAAGRKPFRKNLDGVWRLTKDAAIPRPVRLRLLLLLVAASSADELTEAKKQQLIQDGELTADAHLFANLEHVTRRAGACSETAQRRAERTEHESFCEQRRDGRGSVSESGLHDYGGCGKKWTERLNIQ
ncbi:putative syntaxin binding protein 1 [Trypanosoma cruzi]|uniref:Putative syntaxin binding protein 1 n=1 Tax=Trypanosoma cruzi TaxID=5693 RepID=A0A2V2VXW8_TRYCR|nr:putative syntaxin binding protein 1 [Trypanosoma cruzi]